MFRNVQVEAEHNELILENNFGDKVIIPANKRSWVKQKLYEKCHSCIDKFVSKLPTMSSYAEEGALYSDSLTDPPYISYGDVIKKAPRTGSRQNPDGTESTHLMSYGSIENGKYVAHPTLFQNEQGEWYESENSWEEAKKRGEVWQFDSEEEAARFAEGSWKPVDLPVVTVKDKMPDAKDLPRDKKISAYRKEFMREKPWNLEAWVQERFDNPTGRQRIQKINPTRFKSDLRQQGIKMRQREINEYVRNRIVEDNPQNDMSRGKWLDSLTPEEQKILTQDPKYQTTLFQDMKQGLITFFAGAGELVMEDKIKAVTDKIMESQDLSNSEKAELLKNYKDNPYVTNLLENLKMLSPLEIPAKVVQSLYRDDYSTKDALSGIKNESFLGEDIITDPLNLVGAGLVGKLSKVDKVMDATKVGSKIASKTDDVVKKLKFEDFNNDDEFFRIIVGDEAFDDIIKSGKVRVKPPSSKDNKPGAINLDRRGTTRFPSFSKGKPSLEYANSNPNHYIIRTSDNSIKPSTSGRHGKGTTMFPTDKSGKHLTELDVSKVQVYKHVGNGEYELVNTAKPIVSSVDDIAKNLPKFKSEIDWAKWNKEIPNNKPLMQEYNAIEETTKANGTWMKNPDGSNFDGTPEQFIQQLSTNFKKAFPTILRDIKGNIQKTYHGSPNTFSVFDPEVRVTARTRGEGYYTSPKKSFAQEYANRGDKKLYELYQNHGKKQDVLEKFNKESDERFNKFLKENPRNSKDFDKKFKEFMEKEDEIFDNSLSDDDFKLLEDFDFYVASPIEYVSSFKNLPKSAIGNNGMFDMTNPNIYKGIIPPALLFYLQFQQSVKSESQ